MQYYQLPEVDRLLSGMRIAFKENGLTFDLDT